MIIDDITQAIGDTPLVKITHLDNISNSHIYAKAEYLNPAGSIKDRVALNMIESALARGDIAPGDTLIESTSGNTGIGLAMVCVLKGLHLILTMPDSMSIERRKLLTHLGARIVLTPSSQGINGSIERAAKLHQQIANSYLVRQFTNPDNPNTHYHTTAQEILDDTDRQIDVLVAAIGTGGTIMGIACRLREEIPDIRIVGVEPTSSAVLNHQKPGPHAIQGIGAGFVPEIIDIEMIDEVLTIEDETAIRYAKEAAQKAGLLVGISSGANLAAAHAIASRYPDDKPLHIVTILPDTAERYLSTTLFE